jgi:hypothetical protein
MSTASQIATGWRRQVPEDGPDVINSESDSDNEQHGYVLMDAYRGIPTDSNGDPKGSAHKMENSHTDLVRRQARDTSRAVSSPCSQVSRMDPPPPPPAYKRKATPLNSDEDDQVMSEDQKRCLKYAKKKAGAPLEKSSQANESMHPMATRSQLKKASGAEVRDRQSVQGKRIRVWKKVTLPKPES